ncbi:MAG: nitroreductase family protein [Muribaculaceae bacterium]|nr:nitroreductase family protein [Muribaculaceae bacterium]
MNIIEAIKERRSIRSYDGNGLSDVEITMLNNAIAEAYSPFRGEVKIELLRFGLKGDYKPSTYGVIKGATDYFLICYAADEDSVLAAGFMFEQVVLNAWMAGLGTCWIGGTFKGSTFERNLSLPDNVKLKAVSPVGTPGSTRLLERVTHFVMGSQNRKPFDTLFFEGDFNHPLSPDSRFGEALAMLRLAPSSTNSQPWRALVAGDTVHFYYLPKSYLSLLDCGIGLCHFSETERFNGQKGDFFKASDYPAPPKGWLYLRSYR